MIPNRLPPPPVATKRDDPPKRSMPTALLRERCSHREDRRVIEWAQHLSSALRAGRPVPEELAESITGSAQSVAPDGAGRAAADLARGRGVRESLDAWHRRAGSDGERLIAVALLVALERGADPVVAVDSAVHGLQDDIALRSRLRVLTAQARASAAVLVALPVAFGGLASLLRGEMIYRGPTGAIIITVGLLLDLAGFAWMRRLRRRLT